MTNKGKSTMSITKDGKRLSALLLVLLITLQTISCSASTSVESNAETESETVPETNVETTFLEQFGDEKYDGANYVIMARPLRKTDLNQIAPEALNGEIINDSIYMRNQAISEQFDTNILWLECDEGSFVNTFENSVAASDNSFQFAAIHVIQAGTLAAKKQLLDINSIEKIDTTNPWWNQIARENLTIKGINYIGQCDIPTHSVINNNHILFFNKRIADEYQLGDIYELIREGGWTLDVLKEYMSNVAADTDGDGKMTTKDRYGFITTTGSTSIFLSACNQPIMTMNEDEMPTLVLNTEKTVEIVNKIYDICHTTGETLISDISHEVEYAQLFTMGKSLFYNGYIADMDMFRDMEDSFGLIPPPKYDEAQKEYYTLIQGNSDLSAFPTSLPTEQFDFVGTITEALAALSHQDVRAAIYEEAIKNKYMRDTDSVEMLDMITKNITVDYGFVYDGGFAFLIWNMMEGKNANFASYYASKEKAALTYYEELLSSFE